MRRNHSLKNINVRVNISVLEPLKRNNYRGKFMKLDTSKNSENNTRCYSLLNTSNKDSRKNLHRLVEKITKAAEIGVIV